MTETSNQVTQQPSSVSEAGRPWHLLLGVTGGVIAVGLGVVWLLLTLLKGLTWALAEFRVHIGAMGWGVFALILAWLVVEVVSRYRAESPPSGPRARAQGPRGRLTACAACVATIAIGNGALNIAAARVQAHWESRKQDGVDIYRNHDLSRLVGQCVRLAVLRHAEGPALRADRDALERLADAAPSEWVRLAENGDPRVLSLGDARLTEFIGDAQAVALHVQDWASILREWRAVADAEELDEAEIESAAAVVARDFGVTLREALKADFAKGGKAWAAMQLDIAQTLIRCTTTTAAAATPELTAAIGEIRALIADGAEALPALASVVRAASAAADSHSQDVVRRFDEVVLALARLQRDITDLKHGVAGLESQATSLQSGVESLSADLSENTSLLRSIQTQLPTDADRRRAEDGPADPDDGTAAGTKAGASPPRQRSSSELAALQAFELFESRAQSVSVLREALKLALDADSRAASLPQPERGLSMESLASKLTARWTVIRGELSTLAAQLDALERAAAAAAALTSWELRDLATTWCTEIGKAMIGAIEGCSDAGVHEAVRHLGRMPGDRPQDAASEVIRSVIDALVAKLLRSGPDAALGSARLEWLDGMIAELPSGSALLPEISKLTAELREEPAESASDGIDTLLATGRHLIEADNLDEARQHFEAQRRTAPRGSVLRGFAHWGLAECDYALYKRELRLKKYVNEATLPQLKQAISQTELALADKSMAKDPRSVRCLAQALCHYVELKRDSANYFSKRATVNQNGNDRAQANKDLADMDKALSRLGAEFPDERDTDGQTYSANAAVIAKNVRR